MTEKIVDAKAPAIKANTAVTEKRKPQTLMDYVEVMTPEIKKALPSMVTVERFTRMITTALSKNPELKKCTPQSFLGAMMMAAQAGLEPNTVTGEAWILPYKNHGTVEAQFQIGARGLARLAQRDGTVVLPPQTVYSNDDFSYSLGTEQSIHHVPALKDRGEPIGYYAVWKNEKYGGTGFYFMSKEDVEKHARKYSKAFNSSYSPWSNSFNEMAEKTVVKRVLKWAPMSTEMASAYGNDETIKNQISSDMSLVDDDTDYMDADFSVDNETGEAVENG